MVVVPTHEGVVIEFRNTWAETSGMALSAVSILSLIGWAIWSRRRRKLAEARAEV